MPVSHIGLTVSHLPTSCSFFLSALQPLGYRFIGQQGNQIGLGINDADFFLCQETPGITYILTTSSVKAGAAHIAFTAPDRTAVRDFYTAALNAGARPNGAPAIRNEDTGHFNAAVLDLDGNSVEVVFRSEPDVRDDGTVVEHSRVLTWQKSVTQSIRDDRSVVSARTTHSTSKQALLPATTAALSKAPTVVSKTASMARSVSAPVSIPQVTGPASTSTSSGDNAAKKIIGTLLGAAAGAAVAYAMCKSEEDSARQENEFNAFQAAKAQQDAMMAQVQAAPQHKLSMQDPQPIYETPPKSVHRNISDTDSHYSAPTHSMYAQRAIEAAPRSYHSPTYTSVAPTRVAQMEREMQAIEYVPAASVAPSQTQSSHTHASKHSSTSKHTSKSRSRAPSPPPSTTKSGSIVGSILGRDTYSSASKKDQDNLEISDLNDTDTVAPSDSISQIGSPRRSHRSHKSSTSKSGASSVSKHSSSSKHSKSSKHSSHSHHSSSKKSHHSQYESSPEWHDVDEYIVRPSVASEPSDASTIRPPKSRSGSRKDSAVGGGYEGLFSGNGGWGSGTVASLPIRGITPSMIEESRDGKRGKRSVVSYTMGQ
ncbi:uncharacterized protein BDR25DRAFT_293153 [Lindgomyces ingoldianus]|uniref:Uncharacterized protein n=1 Tax=Lindgomyces ingoldianus TaxID=673940 RepID=A0ACB6QIC7_9PLEO|nr:uncharacterized protein BDR25DRAFT_293153 [Lindgomyces ingoldianus]KAF2466753.1 hypothetical protein BDR25DRAFT_293153 [Lindgomyces ingoldianus]